MDWWRGGKRRREARRDAAVRRGKVLVNRHVERQKSSAARLWELARRALRLDDRVQFEQIARQYVWTIEDLRRWERYALSIESLEARREQARSVTEFMDAVASVSAALLSGADREDIDRARDGIADTGRRAEDLGEELGRLLERTETTVAAMARVREVAADAMLDALERAMASHATPDATDARLDARVAEGIRLVAASERALPSWEAAADLRGGD